MTGNKRTIALVLVLVLPFICNSQLNSTYKVVDREARHSGKQVAYQLEYTGSLSFNNSEIRRNLDVVVSENSGSELHIQIRDSNRQNFEVPQQSPFLVDHGLINEFDQNEQNYVWDIKYDPFCIQVYEKTSRQVIIDTCGRDFVFSEKYLELGSKREIGSKLFGIGERFADFQLNDSQKYVLWSTDNAQGEDKGGDYPTYGNQAILLQMTNRTRNILLFRTSSATELQTDPSFWNFRMVGGILDIKIFVDQNIKALMNSYRQYIGPHAVPPFWSLGHHQCRYGYKDLEHVERVMQGYHDLDIPIDTFWVDIDYLDTFYMFSNDQQKFNRNQFRNLLRKFNKKTVPIIDPVVGANSYIRHDQNKQLYQTVLEGIERNVFLKDETGFPLLAKQWAGAVFVPDFSHPNATQYWIDMFQKFDWPFDGLWIDMNEVSSFVFGKYNVSDEIKYIKEHPEKVTRDPNQNLFIYPTIGFPEQCEKEKQNFPYLPLNDCLSKKTLDINAVHHDGNLELYYHNIFNLLEQHATYLALQKKGHQLPFMITRSNTLNSHKYTFLWTGDNQAGYHSLANSIQGIIRSTFYGIQMSGADMCGFLGITNDKLCARWYQLGSLYPFSRNHNTLGMPDQDPASMGKLTQISAYNNLRLRYSLLRQFYKTMLQNNRHDSFMQSLFMVFDDPVLLEDQIIKTQFMLGEELMSAPILQENQFQRSVYLPAQFYDFHTGQLFNSNIINITNYYNELVPLFIRAGTTVVTQNTDKVRSTNDLSNKLVLKVALDQQNQSKGSFILINDLNNQSDIVQYCINANCIADLHVHFSENELRPAISINIIINDHNTYTKLKKAKKLAAIDKVHFYGLQLTGNQEYYFCINIVVSGNVGLNEYDCYGLKLKTGHQIVQANLQKQNGITRLFKN